MSEQTSKQIKSLTERVDLVSNDLKLIIDFLAAKKGMKKKKESCCPVTKLQLDQLENITTSMIKSGASEIIAERFYFKVNKQ